MQTSWRCACTLKVDPQRFMEIQLSYGTIKLMMSYYRVIQKKKNIIVVFYVQYTTVQLQVFVNC